MPQQSYLVLIFPIAVADVEILRCVEAVPIFETAMAAIGEC